MVASGHFMAAQSDAERTFVKPWKWKKNIKITSSNLDAQQKQIFFCCCRHFFCLIFGCFMLLSFAGIGKFLIQPRDETCSILVSSTEPAMAFGAKCEKNIS
jgi:hypothetical protein